MTLQYVETSEPLQQWIHSCFEAPHTLRIFTLTLIGLFTTSFISTLREASQGDLKVIMSPNSSLLLFPGSGFLSAFYFVNRITNQTNNFWKCANLGSVNVNKLVSLDLSKLLWKRKKGHAFTRWVKFLFNLHVVMDWTWSRGNMKNCFFSSLSTTGHEFTARLACPLIELTLFSKQTTLRIL